MTNTTPRCITVRHMPHISVEGTSDHYIFIILSLSANPQPSAVYLLQLLVRCRKTGKKSQSGRHFSPNL